jgi:hypothetical protein
MTGFFRNMSMICVQSFKLFSWDVSETSRNEWMLLNGAYKYCSLIISDLYRNYSNSGRLPKPLKRDPDAWVAIQSDSSQARSKLRPSILFQHSPWILCKLVCFCASGCIKMRGGDTVGGTFHLTLERFFFLATLREFLVTSLWQIYSPSVAVTDQSV